jgi:putative endonuclease
MALHLELGRKGEALAKTHLESAGYEILDENWTYGRNEVDLIAYKDKVIIFVEVKARTGNGFGEPEDFVDARKQRLLVEAADEYIYLMEHEGEVRFDIIAILFDKKANYTLKHIEDAFWPQGNNNYE